MQGNQGISRRYCSGEASHCIAFQPKQEKATNRERNIKTGFSIICVERRIETTISRRIYCGLIIISKKSINASHFRVLGCNRTSNNGDEEDDNISTACL
jgi:hypothetical protein